MIAPLDVPLDPNAHDARQQLADELAKSEYLQAKPSLFDQALKWFMDWLNSLQAPGGAGPGSAGLVIVGVVLLAVVVVAILVFGLPRLRRRSAVRAPLFGDDDTRSAEALRASSARAAAAGELGTAVLERFRAIARALSERTIVTVSPGTTAQGFAARARDAFTQHGAELERAARDFDAVRYLERPATREQYDALVALDATLERARPRLAAVLA